MMFDSNTIWRTKDGRKIAIRNMTTSDLINTARMLEQKADQYVSTYFSAGLLIHGDLARYYWEDQLESEMSYAEEMRLLGKIMQDEVLSRGSA